MPFLSQKAPHDTVNEVIVISVSLLEGQTIHSQAAIDILNQVSSNKGTVIVKVPWYLKISNSSFRDRYDQRIPVELTRANKLSLAKQNQFFPISIAYMVLGECVKRDLDEIFTWGH